MKNYTVARDGVEIGEFEPFDFFEKVESGEIKMTDWIWMEGMPEWMLVSNIPDIEQISN